MFTRRQFLCGAAAFTLTTPLFLDALAREADAATNNILVLVDLHGGNDSFNMVIPMASTPYSAYMDQRPTIGVAMSQIQSYGTAFDPNTATVSGQATQYAFNPSMGNTSGSPSTNNLRSLYGRGKVAVLAGVGLPATCSLREDHAGAQYYWAVGDPTGSNASGAGWVGASIDQLKTITNPAIQLISEDGYQTALTAASTNQVCVGDLSQFGFNYWITNQSYANGILTAMNSYASPVASGETARSVNSNTIDLVSTFKGYSNAEPLNDYNVNFTPIGGSTQPSGFKDQLKNVAAMILGGAPTKVYYTGFGTVWDTHGTQNANNYHANLLQQVSEGMTEFHDYLAAKNASSNVLVMTISDFGRRAYENASAGTDHGTAGINLLVGDAVKGGFYGAYPGLANAQLDVNGDTLVPVDFRSQLAIGVQWLGADPDTILAGGYSSVASTFPGILT